MLAEVGGSEVEYPFDSTDNYLEWLDTPEGVKYAKLLWEAYGE